jgi:hypothetical protein
MPNIRVDREVYNFLKHRAEAFVDTPNSVLRRLLGLDASNLPEGDGGFREEVANGAPVGAGAKEKRRARGPAQRSSGKKGRRVPRLAPGSPLPEDEYVAPLLTALAERGGIAPAREVIEEIGQRLGNRLSPVDVETLPSGVVRWRNRAQFVRLRLVEEGLLSKNAPRGVWALTDAGREAAADLKRRQPAHNADGSEPASPNH